MKPVKPKTVRERDIEEILLMADKIASEDAEGALDCLEWQDDGDTDADAVLGMLANGYGDPHVNFS